MKHLQSIDELLKSTYLSASRGLDRHHSKRSKEMKSYAAEKGEDVKVERIYPYKFILEKLPNEYFFITSVSHEELDKDKKLKISVNLQSNWGQNESLNLYFTNYNPARYRVEECYFRFESDYPIFTNSDVVVARKNANHLLKFFKQYWEDELSKDYPDYTIKNLTVNNLYKSPNG